MRAGGPLRIAAWPIWSGRERSSHSHLPQVPQIRLANLPPFPIRLFFTLPPLFRQYCCVQRRSFWNRFDFNCTPE